MHDALGNEDRVARTQFVCIVAIGVGTGAGKDIENFFAVGVIVRWVLLPGIDEDDAEGLFRVCIYLCAVQPADGPPWESSGRRILRARYWICHNNLSTGKWSVSTIVICRALCRNQVFPQAPRNALRLKLLPEQGLTRGTGRIIRQASVRSALSFTPAAAAPDTRPP